MFDIDYLNFINNYLHIENNFTNRTIITQLLLLSCLDMYKIEVTVFNINQKLETLKNNQEMKVRA